MTGIEPGWKEAPELQGKGSADWHGYEREILAYLADYERENFVLKYALCSAVDTAYCPIPTLWRVTCPQKLAACLLRLQMFQQPMTHRRPPGPGRAASLSNNA